jgi:anti-sigma B factor antagonist
MQFETRLIEDVLIVKTPASRIDAASAIQFKEQMRNVMQDAPGRVVLDMENVGFVDSSGLGALVAVFKLTARERSFELAALQPTVQKLFELTRMNSVFQLHKTAADALMQS